MADGSLPESERERALALVRSSPELAEELERQRRALAAIEPLHAMNAPAELSASVASILSDAPSRPPRRRLALRLAPVGALVVAGAAVAALVLGSSGSSAPTVRQAALLALRPATLPPPPESRSRRNTLARSVDGIPFPYWQDALGWRSTGARTDRVAGHATTTVFYAPMRTSEGAARVGYTILAGRALTVPNAPTIVRRGIRFSVIANNGATILTWRRAGHTCILTARGVTPQMLAHLASWV